MTDYLFDHREVVRWKSHLATEGFVVLTGVLTEEQLKIGLASFIGQFGTDSFAGFIDEPTFVSSDFAWYSRTQPNILQAYAHIYNLQSASELVTAIDRGSAIPNQPTADTDEATAYWLHVDYPLLDVGKKDIPEIYQSFLSYVDAGGPTAPGLRVVPRSATIENYKRILADNHDGDLSSNPDLEPTYWLLSAEHIDVLESKVVEVVSPAGSLTLWRSGLIHDNTTAVLQADCKFKLSNRKSKTTQCPLARLAVYLCYAPQSWATAEELELRQLIYKRGQTTTHWPVTYLSLHEEACQRWAWRQMINKYPAIEGLVPIQ